MSYKREYKAIIPGGINLLPPIDSGPEDDSLILYNWRSDQVGQLKTRGGYEVGSITWAANVHSLWKTQHQSGWFRYGGSGTNVYRNSTTLSSGADGSPLNFVHYAGFVWIMNRNIQKKDSGSALTDWWIAGPTSAPTAALGSGTGLTGEVNYYVTFSTADNHETNPWGTAASPSANPANQDVVLTNIPTGGSTVTKRHIYRIGSTLTSAYRLHTLGDNTTTTWTDDGTKDDVAINLKIVLEVDHDAPPAARRACEYFARILAWNTAANPNGLYWTPVQKPWYFPAVNFCPVGAWAEEIIQVVQHTRMTYIYKSGSIWRAVGNLDDVNASGEIERIEEKVGLIGAKAICSDGYTDYFVGSDFCVYKFNGDHVERVSDKIAPIFRGETVVTGPAYVAPPLNRGYASTIAMVWWLGQVWVSYPGSTNQVPSHTVILDVATGRWFQNSLGFSALHSDGGALVGTTSVSGNIKTLESTNADDTFAFYVLWQSRYLHQGFPDNDKLYTEIMVEHNTGGEVFTLKIRYNWGATEETLGTFSSSVMTPTVFPINSGDGTPARNISMFVEATTDVEAVIKAVQVSYLVDARKNRTVVTLPLKFSEYLIEGRQLKLDTDLAADATAVVYSDGLGGEIAAVETLAIEGTANPGRKTYVAPFSALRYGRLWKLKVTSASVFQVYSAELDGREIPVFVDGAAGQVWTTPPIGV